MNRKWKSVALSLLILAGCSDEETDNKIGFEVSSETVSEADGTIEINVQLNRAVDESTSLYFEVGGDAALNGDFKLVTSSPVSIKAGATEATIEIELLDESIIESSEDLSLTLTAAGNGIAIEDSKSEIILTIEDNDDAPTDGIQVDLTWSNESVQDIDEFDLDLYILNNVVLGDNSLDSYDIVSKSENTSGFESVWSTEADPDGEFYIMIYYAAGNDDVDFVVTLNGAGWDNDSGESSFQSDEVGYITLFGPFMKDGSSFTYNGRAKSAIIKQAFKGISFHK